MILCELMKKRRVYYLNDNGIDQKKRSGLSKVIFDFQEIFDFDLIVELSWYLK